VTSVQAVAPCAARHAEAAAAGCSIAAIAAPTSRAAARPRISAARITPVPSRTRIDPALSAAFSFWPALNLPTGIVPSRRLRERSHLQSEGANRLSRRRSAR